MKKIISLKNLILAGVFFLPLYAVVFRWGIFSLNLWELLVILIFFLFLWERGLRSFRFPSGFVAWLMVALFFGLFSSAFWGNNLWVSLGIIKGWFVFPAIFAWMTFLVFSEEEKEKPFRVLYYSGVLVALISLILFFEGKITYDGRLSGIFNSPNYLAMYLAPAFIIGLIDFYFRFQEKVFSKKMVFQAIGLATILGVVYLTKSYWGWLSLALSLIVAAWFFLKERRKRIIFFLLFVLLGFILLQRSSDKFGGLISLNSRSSLNSRLMIWSSAEKIGMDNWFWGIGPGNFQEKYLEYQKFFPPYLEWAVPHPHNVFLAFWLSSGVIGLISFLGLLFLWFQNIFTGKVEKKADFLKIAISAIMIYFLLHGLLDTVYFKNDLAVVFWLVYFFSFSRELSYKDSHRVD